MPRSSVSDFEIFALKVEKHIAAKVKRSEEETSAHGLQKKEKSLCDTEKCMQQKRSDWQLKLHTREQQEKRAIADEIAQQWSAFKKEFEMAVKETLRKRFKEEFPTLAECFVKWVSQQYQTGVFISPAIYGELVNTEKFDLEVCQEEKIVFRQDNLYIEYSVERIMEELKDEMTAMENPWQA